MAEAIASSAGYVVQPELFLSTASQFNPSGNVVRTASGSGTVLIDATGAALSALLAGYISYVASPAASLAGNVTLSGINVGSLSNVAMGPANTLYQAGTSVQTLLQSGTALNAASESALASGPVAQTCSNSVIILRPTSNCSIASQAARATLIADPPSSLSFTATLAALRGDVWIAKACSSTGVVTGIRGLVILRSGSSNTHTQISGGNFTGIVMPVDADATGTTVSHLDGVTAAALAPPSSDASGASIVVTTASALRATGLPANASSASLAVNTSVGVEVADMGASSVTTAAGIRLSDQTTASTNTYGIWFNTNSTGKNAGVVFGTAGDTAFWRGTANRLLTTGDWSARHYLSSAVPTVAAGAAAGTSPTLSVTGTDHGCTVSLTVGTVPTTGTLFTVSYGGAWATQPRVVFSARNDQSALLSGTTHPYVSSTSTSQFVFTSGSAALTNAVNYVWNFVSF
jgi:hypothetical protein